MLVNISDDLIRLRRMGLLEALLLDHSSRRNILWASDAYASLGSAYGRNEEMYALLVAGEHIGLIKTRARKEFEQQTERTRKRAEVFTPFWVVKKMNDYADAVWFGRESGFSRTDSQGRVRFTARRTWRQYVENRRMELTCGEAPFLVTRYDVETGELIPLPERTGLLDRKLRAVDENAESPDEWLEWSYKALRAVYGYEFLGDNLLIARVNVLTTFEEHMEALWHRRPTPEQYKKAIRIITWNLWQMDGLTGQVPNTQSEHPQLNLFQLNPIPPPSCRIYNWRQHRSFQLWDAKGEGAGMKFDIIIGNPPYQEENELNNRKKPIYNHFMEESFHLGKVVELVTPARFLFNAGYTPKDWNQKMLNDEHFHVLYYEPDRSKIFPGKDIKGGIVISIYDHSKNFGKIRVFTPFVELNQILQKATKAGEVTCYLSDVISSRGMYRFTSDLSKDFPDALSKLGKGTGNMIASNAFERLPEIFLERTPNDGIKYIKMLGLVKKSRVHRYIKAKYVMQNDYISSYNVLFPKANGNGEYGEILSLPEISDIGAGATDSFISIGTFSTKYESKSVVKYIKTKFLRALLGIKKVTQDCPRAVWQLIPLQDFSSDSDIDWSQSIPEIDRQLYAKYGLDETEIEFIETHVKEMR